MPFSQCSTLVPLTTTRLSLNSPGWPERAVVGRQHVVKRRGLPMRADLRIRMPFIVQHLVLVTDRRVAILEHEVLEAAVASWRDLPFPRQFEDVVRLSGDHVERAARITAACGIDGECSIFDLPATSTRRPASCSRAIRVSVFPSKSGHPFALRENRWTGSA